jgi:hypothetical protein
MKRTALSVLFLGLINPIFSQTLPVGVTSIKPYLFTDKVTIGANQVANKIYIVDNTSGGLGSVDERFFIRLHNTDNTVNSGVTQEMLSGNSGAKMEIGQFGANYGTGNLNTVYANRGTIIARGGSGLIIRSSPDPNGSYIYDGITFQTGSNTPERMRITGTGLVGIGTTAPKSKLQVTDGDVYVDNPNRGIILKSPNGSCWRITMDDAGNFVKTAITCP